MRYREFAFLLVLVPGLAVAQVAMSSSRSTARDLDGTHATTLAVLRANCPKDMPEADWLKLMAQPENATLYPLRITQAMLDTLNGSKMDLRYRYILVKDMEAR